MANEAWDFPADALVVSGGVKTDENRRFENPSGQMA
jgi:hypothetical protein